MVVGSPQWDKEMLVRGQTSCDNQYTCSSLTIDEFSEGTMDLLIPVGADLMLGWMVPLLTHTEADRLVGWQPGVILS